jgi:hypothetical protein
MIEEADLKKTCFNALFRPPDLESHGLVSQAGLKLLPSLELTKSMVATVR